MISKLEILERASIMSGKLQLMALEHRDFKLYDRYKYERDEIEKMIKEIEEKR